jgi:hypothetical protein
MVKICLSLTFGMATFALAVSTVSFSRPPSNPAPLSSESVSMKATAWNILYSPSMPAHPNPNTVGGGWYFDFPSCNGTDACSVNYVTVPVSLAASTHVRAVFQIATTGTPAFHYKLEANNTCGYPAHVRYILQRRGDDLTAKSEFHRWFSLSGFKLEEGSAELSVPLRPDLWVSVFGTARGPDFGRRCKISVMSASYMVADAFMATALMSSGGSARFLASEYSIE